MVTSWSPRGHLVPPRGHPECLSVVIFQRFDPYKLGDCASWSHIWRPPPPLIGFLRRTLDPYGGTRGKSHVYIPTEISDPKIAPSSPRVHPEFTPSSPAVHHCRWRCRCHWQYSWQRSEELNPELRFWRPLCCGFGDRCVAITLDPHVVHLSPRLIYRLISSCWL